MAVVSLASLTQTILDLPEEENFSNAINNFANMVGDFMDEVQAGPTGTPGIFTFNRAVFVTELMSLTPVADNSWVSLMADAWETAVLASLITPGTVTDPGSWSISGVDTLTSPSAATTITTIPAAKAVMVGLLNTATFDNNPPEPLAQAIRDATLSFQFLTVGVAPPSTPVPVLRSAL